MTPEEFIPYLRGLLDAQQEETALVKLLKKKLDEVETTPKVKFPLFRSSDFKEVGDFKIPNPPRSQDKVYC